MDIVNTKIKSILNEKNTKITPSNIKKDVNVLGVTGTFTSDANATANDIVTGKTAYANGQKLTGTYEGIIPSGSISITDNGTVDVTNYASANVDVQATSEYNAKVYTDAINDPNIYFPTIRYLVEECPPINLGNHTSCIDFFSNDYYLKKVNLFDTSKVTSMATMFRNCVRLETMPEFDTTKVTSFQNCWMSCSSLSDETLNNILAMCYKSAVTNNKTLAYAGLSSSQTARCESLSNWQAFYDAGWRKGY